MEQTSSAAYPNLLVVDYVKKARAASPRLLMQAEHYLQVGYQKLLTFERPGGGFDWWGSGPPLVWLSAYALQGFHDMARVYPVDRAVIERTQKWLLAQQAADGSWSNPGGTHGESIERVGNPKLVLTSYVAWSLLESGVRTPAVLRAVDYVGVHVRDAGNAYVLALAANALAAWDVKDDRTQAVLRRLERMKQDVTAGGAACYPAEGQSLTYARGGSLTVETTALAVLALVKDGRFANSINRATAYLLKSREASGTWGSTSATVLALKALVATAGGSGTPKEPVDFMVAVNGNEAARGEVTPRNAELLQVFDLTRHVRRGRNTVTIEARGETGLMYQVVGRYYVPWGADRPARPVLDVAMTYDRTRLSTKDLLRAEATLKYHGAAPTYMVIVELGIPPGFTADPGDFAELVGAGRVQKFQVTSRTVTLYLGDVKPGAVASFPYTLRPKYPIRARAPATVAYEYYTPANRAAAPPTELVVQEK